MTSSHEREEEVIYNSNLEEEEMMEEVETGRCTAEGGREKEEAETCSNMEEVEMRMGVVEICTHMVEEVGATCTCMVEVMKEMVEVETCSNTGAVVMEMVEEVICTHMVEVAMEKEEVETYSNMQVETCNMEVVVNERRRRRFVRICGGGDGDGGGGDL
ncbi:uncharacterized protein LOC114760625 [Neltuma alba]|uniref:uncharacterized protein LOC114760625 n=1 Tax=Neltuma alba TaxID=207710 RepID=UPI0010A35B88|nr:uncharacterized protein LOC114760625 [Prosopis alba]